MPSVDYRCALCGAIVEYSWVGGDAPPSLVYPHADNRGVQCAGTTLFRVWSPIGIGRVVGAGDSPGRVSKRSAEGGVDDVDDSPDRG